MPARVRVHIAKRGNTCLHHAHLEITARTSGVEKKGEWFRPVASAQKIRLLGMSVVRSGLEITPAASLISVVRRILCLCV